MTSRDEAIKVAMADGIPIHKGHVAEVLDRASEAHQIHYADQCPRGKSRVQAAKRAKREADERCIALVAERDALRERLEALEEIRQRVADGWTADHGYDFEPKRQWVRPGRYPEEISPGVASLLWPEDTSA